MGTLSLGTLIAISSTSWFGSWLGLEINLLSFIPLMSNHSNQFSTESALKYFLTQALASTILLFAIIFLGFTASLTFSLTIDSSFLSMLFSSALLLKMGAAPFHFWFPGVMEGLSWTNGLLLMTWQKIAPLMLLSYLFTLSQFSIFVILSCSVAGALGGFNQTSLRKIMAYSSINHLGWMLAALLIGETYWITYFFFYVVLSLGVVLLFNSSQLSHINQIFYAPWPDNTLKMLLFCSLLSLGGLPPFLGFFPKWMIIQSLVGAGLTSVISVMVLLTLITLYFYIRVGYAAFMLTHTEPKWNFNSLSHAKPPVTVIVVISVSLSGLLFCCCILPVL